MRNKKFFVSDKFFNIFFTVVLSLIVLMFIGMGIAIYYALSDGLPWAIAIIEKLTRVPKP